MMEQPHKIATAAAQSVMVAQSTLHDRQPHDLASTTAPSPKEDDPQRFKLIAKEEKEEEESVSVEEYLQAKRNLKRTLLAYAQKAAWIKRTRLAIHVLEEAQSNIVDKLIKSEGLFVPDLSPQDQDTTGDDSLPQPVYHSSIPLPLDAEKVIPALRRTIPNSSSTTISQTLGLALETPRKPQQSSTAEPFPSSPSGSVRTSTIPPAITTPVPSSIKEKGSRRSAETKLKKVYEVPRDAQGNFVLPFSIGMITVLSLGQVAWDRSSFWNDRYIYPIGFRATRQYPSMYDASRSVSYECEIVDGGEAPIFKITPEDAPNKIITHTSATGAWGVVLRAANELRHRESSNSVSGPDYFGYGIPTVAKLIQELPGVEKCEGFQLSLFRGSRPLPSANVSLSTTPAPSSPSMLGI